MGEMHATQPSRQQHLPTQAAAAGGGGAWGSPLARALLDHLIGDVVATELPAVVKGAIKGVVSARIPMKKKRALAHERIYDSLLATVATDVIGEECAAVVAESVHEMASSYMHR